MQPKECIASLGREIHTHNVGRAWCKEGLFFEEDGVAFGLDFCACQRELLEFATHQRKDLFAEEDGAGVPVPIDTGGLALTFRCWRRRCCPQQGELACGGRAEEGYVGHPTTVPSASLSIRIHHWKSKHAAVFTGFEEEPMATCFSLSDGLQPQAWFELGGFS